MSPIRWTAAIAVGAAATTAYMLFEAQWVRCEEADLQVPGLPTGWAGLRILHLSDVHAGFFPTNERSLEKVIRWAVSRRPDLVVLTGDVFGNPRRSARSIRALARLQPPLGMFAVTGNHEYGLGKHPLARPTDTSRLWEQAGITLLTDTCVALPAREGSRIVLYGADHLTRGFGLLHHNGRRKTVATTSATGSNRDLPVLLIHEAPPADSLLAQFFPLAFSGHTHGGQLRLPTRNRLRPIHQEERAHLAGVHDWGKGRLVVSRGVGTSFLPFRLFTRPEASLWRLV